MLRSFAWQKVITIPESEIDSSAVASRLQF